MPNAEIFIKMLILSEKLTNAGKRAVFAHCVPKERKHYVRIVHILLLDSRISPVRNPKSLSFGTGKLFFFLNSQPKKIPELKKRTF